MRAAGLQHGSLTAHVALGMGFWPQALQQVWGNILEMGSALCLLFRQPKKSIPSKQPAMAPSAPPSKLQEATASLHQVGAIPSSSNPFPRIDAWEGGTEVPT